MRACMHQFATLFMKNQAKKAGENRAAEKSHK
jgi:hypothetical protein